MQQQILMRLSETVILFHFLGYSVHRMTQQSQWTNISWHLPKLLRK